MSARLQALFVMVAALSLQPGAHAQSASNKPPIPPGAPTQGFAVALLSDGVDYTRPEIAKKLARDGEGVVIGWDAIDGDQRPFLANSAATRLVEIAPFLIAPFRLKLDDAASWQRASEVLKRTPARVAVVAATPSAIGASGAWDAPLAAMPDVLFVVPAEEAGAPSPVGNVILVAALLPSGAVTKSANVAIAPAAAAREMPTHNAASPPPPTTNHEAALLLPSLFACTDLRAAKSPADVKRLLLAKAQKSAAGTPPLLGLCR